MNTKMSKFSFKDVQINEKRGGAKGRGRLKNVLVDCGVIPYDKNKNVFRWRISLSARCAQMAGLKAGDAISFEYDEGVILLKKSDDGRILGSCKGSRELPRLYVRFNMPKHCLGYFADLNASEIETAPDGRICFKLV